MKDIRYKIACNTYYRSIQNKTIRVAETRFVDKRHKATKPKSGVITESDDSNFIKVSLVV